MTESDTTDAFRYTCSCCGELHEGSPSFGYKAPDAWLSQPEAVQKKGQIGSDLCFYEDEDGKHYFARTVIEVPIHGIDEPFTWGVWVSLSEKSYNHYIDTWEQAEPDYGYFGWVCNRLPYYDNTYALATDVYPQNGGNRPLLHLHETEHALYHDFKNGISAEKAQEIAELCLHGKR